MTEDKISEIILDDPELKSLALAGRDGDLANDKRLAESQAIEYRLTSLGVLDIFGAIRGAAILQGLRAAATGDFPIAPVLRELLPHLDGAGVNVGHSDAVTVFNALTQAGIVSPEEAKTVLSRGRTSVQPSVQAVSRALRKFRPEGKVGKYSSAELKG